MGALITTLTSVSNIAKRFNAHGQKLKGSHFFEGTFLTYIINDLTDLRNLLFQIKSNPNMCLMLGVFDIYRGKIVTKDKFNLGGHSSDTRTRTLRCVKWNGVAVFMFDYDFVHGMKEELKAENFDELYSLILKVLPEFENVEMLFEYSSSSFIYDKNTNTYVSSKIGIHVYFIVSNCSNESVKNFKEELENRMISLDLVQRDNSGKIEHYLFDLSVFSPEREIITSKPILPQNLAVHETANEMRIFNETKDVFDLSSIKSTSKFNKEVPLRPILSINNSTRLSYLAILSLNKKVDYKKLIAFLDGYIVEFILRNIGYQISNMKFKLRAENTPSVSIMRENGFINDFGGEFKGSIIDLLTKYHNLDFKQAVKYLRACFMFKDEQFDFSALNIKSPYEICEILYKGVVVDYSLEVPKIEVYKANKEKELVDKKAKLQQLAVSYKESVWRDSEPELKDVLAFIKDDKYAPKIDKLYPTIIDEFTRVGMGYSGEYDSLVIILYKNEEAQTVAIRRNNSTKSKEWVKWKKHGSSSYIPYNILDNTDTVYVAFGMMEIILFEILGLSYVVFQSDDVARSFKNNSQFMEIIVNTIDKNIVIFPDNDESCKGVIYDLKMSFSNSKSIKVINFEEILGQELQKGYDLIDYVNEHGLNIF